MLEEGRSSDKPPLMLDVRNSYEWDAGHFEGAARPLEVRAGQPCRRLCLRPACVLLVYKSTITMNALVIIGGIPTWYARCRPTFTRHPLKRCPMRCPNTWRCGA